MAKTNIDTVDVKQEKRNMFNEFTKVWTRLAQVMSVIILAGIVFMFVGFSLVPGISDMLLANLGKDALAEGNVYTIMELWILPSLFTLIVLSVGTCILIRQIWRKSDKICIQVREAVISHHEGRIARAQAINERNAKSSKSGGANKRKEKE